MLNCENIQYLNVPEHTAKIQNILAVLGCKFQRLTQVDGSTKQAIY